MGALFILAVFSTLLTGELEAPVDEMELKSSSLKEGDSSLPDKEAEASPLPLPQIDGSAQGSPEEAGDPCTEDSSCFVQEIQEEESSREDCLDVDLGCDPEKRWYFEIKPGYYHFTDPEMHGFYGDGGFTIRAETGYRFWTPLIVWVDAGYFQKSGHAIGGDEHLEIKLATITLGLKGIYYFNSCLAVYAGAGPRLFIMMLHNDSPFVRGDDNEVGIGGGFDAGIWLYPIPSWPNLFIDAFADFSWKKMEVEPDEISSLDNDVDVSGISAGLGVGVRF